MTNNYYLRVHMLTLDIRGTDITEIDTLLSFPKLLDVARAKALSEGIFFHEKHHFFFLNHFFG